MRYARDLLLVDIVSADYFFSNLLPPIPDAFSTEVLIQDIRERDLLYEEAGKLYWNCFGDDDKEDQRLLQLKDVFENAVSSSSKLFNGLEQTHFFTLNSYAKQYCQGNGLRPDAYFVKKQTISVPVNEDISWYDIACVGECRRKEATDNTFTVLYGLHRILATDACRRFAFGFAVNGNVMSLWHASRVALLKCSFDYTADPEYLVRLFTSIAFAKSNGQETGWDPTVTVVYKTGIMQYLFEVDGKHYTTKKLLANFAARSILGRGTRVFLVYEEGKENIFYVLKDVWRDANCVSESGLVAEMLEAVKVQCGAAGAETVRKHMVTIVKDCLVCVDGREDHTLEVIMRGTMPVIEQTEKLYNFDGMGSGCYRDIGNEESYDSYEWDEAQLYQEKAARRPVRKHCRLLLKEYGKPVQKLARLSDVVVALDGATKALFYIHKAGWVHRDISAGNIYLYEGRGLLADFEFAKKVGTALEYEVKTGTTIYMAYEAIRRFFVNFESDFVTDRTDSSDAFFHNPLHDMESIFWVYAASLTDVETEDYVARGEIVDALFSGLKSRDVSRKDFISPYGGQMANYRSLLGEKRVDLLVALLDLKKKLIKCYKESEEPLPTRPPNEEKFTDPHKQFEDIWARCMQFLSRNDVALVSSRNY